MMGMHALHVEVSKPAMPQYGVALGNEGNTRKGITRILRWKAWG
jgi:hypothetical protein